MNRVHNTHHPSILIMSIGWQPPGPIKTNINKLYQTIIWLGNSARHLAPPKNWDVWPIRPMALGLRRSKATRGSKGDCWIWKKNHRTKPMNEMKVDSPSSFIIFLVWALFEHLHLFIVWTFYKSFWTPKRVRFLLSMGQPSNQGFVLTPQRQFPLV